MFYEFLSHPELQADYFLFIKYIRRADALLF